MINNITIFIVFFILNINIFAAPGVLEEIDLDLQVQSSILGTMFPEARVELFKKTYVTETISENTNKTYNIILIIALWNEDYYVFIETFDKQKNKCYECKATLGYAVLQRIKDTWLIKKPYTKLANEGMKGRYKPHVSLALANKTTPAFIFINDEQVLDNILNKKLLIFFGEKNYNLQEVLNLQLNQANSCQPNKESCIKKYVTAHFIPGSDSKSQYYTLLLSINIVEIVENIAEKHNKKLSTNDVLFQYNSDKAKYDIDPSSVKLAEDVSLILNN